MPKYAVILIICCLFAVSCTDTTTLKERENAITEKEIRLAEKEKRLADIEADYQDLKRMRDSINSIQDTLVNSKTWPAEIAGKWNSKITCTESNCPEYAVGDIRTDNWEFVSDSLKRTVNVINSRNELVRSYTASVQNNEILLNFRSDSTASRQVVMNVNLSVLPEKLQGRRQVIINDNCTATFNIELTRP